MKPFYAETHENSVHNSVGIHIGNFRIGIFTDRESGYCFHSPLMRLKKTDLVTDVRFWRFAFARKKESNK